MWSDGVPITAADFIYAWQQQDGGDADAAYPSGDQASILGYSDIASMKASNQGRTVTVVFSTPFADWQMLFTDLLPAHVMEKVGWDPGVPHRRPGHRPLRWPVQDRLGDRRRCGHHLRRATPGGGARRRCSTGWC